MDEFEKIEIAKIRQPGKMFLSHGLTGYQKPMILT